MENKDDKENTALLWIVGNLREFKSLWKSKRQICFEHFEYSKTIYHLIPREHFGIHLESCKFLSYTVKSDIPSLFSSILFSTTSYGKKWNRGKIGLCEMWIILCDRSTLRKQMKSVISEHSALNILVLLIRNTASGTMPPPPKVQWLVLCLLTSQDSTSGLCMWRFPPGFIPHSKNTQVGLIGESESPVGANNCLNDCLSLYRCKVSGLNFPFSPPVMAITGTGSC